MIKRLNTKEQYFASTQEEAEDLLYKIIDETKPQELAGYSIQQKSNKNGIYFVVTFNFKYNTPAGLMESEENGEVFEDDVDLDEEETDENQIEMDFDEDADTEEEEK